MAGRERHRLLRACAVYIGRYRQIFEVARAVVEWVGVVAIRQRKAKPMRRQARFDRAHQVIDRIRFVARDRRARWLEAGDRRPRRRRGRGLSLGAVWFKCSQLLHDYIVQKW